MSIEDKTQPGDNRLMCPRKAGTKNPRCWEQHCAIWDRRRNQCAYLTHALTKAEEVEQAQEDREVAERLAERKPGPELGW